MTENTVAATVLKTGDWNKAEEDKAVKLYKTYERDVDKVAQEMGRARRSVIGKLGTLGVYVKPEKPIARKKDEGPTKNDLQREIENKYGFSMDGFEPATKDAHKRLLARLVELTPAD